MKNLWSRTLWTCAFLLNSPLIFAQAPQISTVSSLTPPTSVPSALQAAPYSFDFQDIQIDRATQLIESIQPMDIVFAPKINVELTSPIHIKDKSLLDILQAALKPHQFNIRTLDRDLFWIDQQKKANETLTFARYQHHLTLMPIEICDKKTSLVLKQLNAKNMHYQPNDMLQSLGKKSRFRAEINNQQVQIYCIRQFEDVSAKIIVIGTQKNQVERTLNQLIEGYKN